MSVDQSCGFSTVIGVLSLPPAMFFSAELIVCSTNGGGGQGGAAHASELSGFPYQAFYGLKYCNLQKTEISL